jgi:heme oxygenase
MSILQTIQTYIRPKRDLMKNLIGLDRLNDFSIEDYTLFLSANYIFHSNLEQNISFFLSVEARDEQIKKVNFTNRIKNVSLEIELKNLVSPSIFQTLRLEESVIPFSGFNGLLGCLYVAEGSMLESEMMYEVLSQNPKISEVTTFHFFKNYEGRVSKLWKSFTELVEEECQTELDQKIFLEGVEKSYLQLEQSFYRAKNILQ